ncbi:hypothetical protein HDU87_003349 [Geranomyces variabilis]|uniref:ditrans,polycis-polyprenyl diphosphate synthase [(2E,6E)-farnesyldiphosphate specific] n=1 Tax=Geranomyces variabilis TaxID=109894 RepID=A0AAD5TKZ4_9FUNG|nr:hypothetical protein HDU87_003349 [Geranomyces variabilis]
MGVLHQLIPPAILKPLLASSSRSGSSVKAFYDLCAQAFWEFIEDLLHFIESVDWSEPFLSVMIAFHIGLVVWMLRSQKSHLQTAINFTVVAVLVCFARPLNNLLSANYALFSRVNYFDPHGAFMGVMWLAPLMADMVFLMWTLLEQTSEMMVQVKKKQMQLQRKRAEAAAAKPASIAPAPRRRKASVSVPLLRPMRSAPHIIVRALHWLLDTYARIVPFMRMLALSWKGAPRVRGPSHVAVSFRGLVVPYPEEIARIVGWCINSEVAVLTLHDTKGTLKERATDIAETLVSANVRVLVSGMDIGSPPAEPPALYLNIVSNSDGRAALAAVARALATHSSKPVINVDSVTAALQAGKVKLPSDEPNLIFLTHTTISSGMDIGNFVPWDIRLTEFAATKEDLILPAFDCGLRQYAKSQKRFGK